MTASPFLQEDGVWTFDNGVKLYKRHILRDQMELYRRCNVHEPEEERHFTELLQAARHGVVVDAGAGVGYYTILARKLRPDLEIHAINPDPEFVEFMTLNLELNKTAPPHLHQVALSDRRGQGRLSQPGCYSAWIEEGDDIICLPLREVVTESIALLKIDVQGAELEVLRGAPLERIEALLVGTHSDSLHQACRDYLAEHGFALPFDEAVVEGQYDGLIVAVRPSS